MDGKGMQSQRVLLLGHPSIQATTMERVASELDRKAEGERKRNIAANRKEIRKRHLIVEKVAGSGRRKPVNDTVRHELRVESKRVKEAGPTADDVPCLSCDALFSVLKKNPQYNVCMFWCQYCEEYQCSLCATAKESSFIDNHEATCEPTLEECDEEIEEDEEEEHEEEEHEEEEMSEWPIPFDDQNEPGEDTDEDIIDEDCTGNQE